MADSHIRKFFPDYDPDEPGWTLINQASKISEAFAYEDEIKETSYKLLEILIPLQQALAKLAQRHFGETVNESVSLQNKIISELISMARQKHIKDFQKNWYHDRIMLTSGSIVKLKEQTTKACEEVDKALVTILPPAYLTRNLRNLYHGREDSLLTPRQQLFVTMTTRKLEQYLRHLHSILKSKLFEVQFLLMKLRANDIDGFIDRWHEASIMLARHRPKTFLGQSLAFTSIFPYPGKSLVTAINKLGKELIINRSILAPRI
jgi:hypothetical protein